MLVAYTDIVSSDVAIPSATSTLREDHVVGQFVVMPYTPQYYIGQEIGDSLEFQWYQQPQRDFIDMVI